MYVGQPVHTNEHLQYRVPGTVFHARVRGTWYRFSAKATGIAVVILQDPDCNLFTSMWLYEVRGTSTQTY